MAVHPNLAAALAGGPPFKLTTVEVGGAFVALFLNDVAVFDAEEVDEVLRIAGPLMSAEAVDHMLEIRPLVART